MKGFIIVETHYGILYYDDFICIFDMSISSDYYFGIRVLNDKLDELVDALNQINSGIVSEAIVSEGSPIMKNGNNYNADIIIRRSNNLFCILSGCQSGNDFVYECGGFFTDSKVLPELIQALKGIVTNGAVYAEYFIKPDYDSDNDLMYWIIVLKFDNCVVVLSLDSRNSVYGMSIPMTKISDISKKLIKKYETHMKAILQGINANTDFSLLKANGRGVVPLPSADSSLFVAQTLMDIKDSPGP